MKKVIGLMVFNMVLCSNTSLVHCMTRTTQQAKEAILNKEWSSADELLGQILKEHPRRGEHRGDNVSLWRVAFNDIKVNFDEVKQSLAENNNLWNAAYNDWVNIGEILINSGAEIDEENYEGCSPLHYAAMGNSKDMLEFIFSYYRYHYGLDIEQRDSDHGCTALHWAVIENSMDAVKILIAHRADINAKKFVGRPHGYKNITPLSYAVNWNHRDIIEVLIKAGADVNVEYIDQYTLFHWIACNRDEKILNLLEKVSVTSDTINTRDDDGRTALDYAINNHDNPSCGYYCENVVKFLENVVKFLIGKGADIGSWKSNKYDTVLEWSIDHNYKDISDLVISKDKKQSSRMTNSSLHFAIDKNDKDLFAYILSKGGRINDVDKDGKTPLHHVVEKNIKGWFEYIISKGVDINCRDISGKTPLHYAVEKNSGEWLEYIVNKGADINAKDNRGKTPLHYAVNSWGHVRVNNSQHNYIDSISFPEFLLDKGALIDAKDDFGKTPLHYAAGNANLVEIFIGDVKLRKICGCLTLTGSRADINARDKDGKTPLHYAVENSSFESVRMLVEKGQGWRLCGCPIWRTGGVNINAKDNSGNTPLQIAQNNQDIRLCDFLKNHGAEMETPVVQVSYSIPKSGHAPNCPISKAKRRPTPNTYPHYYY